MTLRSVSLVVPGPQAAPLVDALLAAGAVAAAVDQPEDAVAELDWMGIDDAGATAAAWHSCVVSALFEAPAPSTGCIDEALALAQLASTPYTLRDVPEADWVRQSQSQFQPIQVDSRLWIVPSWQEPPDPGAVNIRVDPGRAFGTGGHESTRLCLRWLGSELRIGERVLDYGCGSGILAIAAKKLGAGPVTGIDIDPQAVETARDNAVLNGVSVRFALPGIEPLAPAQVTLANILASPLRLLAPLLAESTVVGGRIVLAGLLSAQSGAVSAAYDSWFKMARYAAEGDWICLSGIRYR
jgi:ribosomal protein L11 methyltransferase